MSLPSLPKTAIRVRTTAVTALVAVSFEDEDGNCVGMSQFELAGVFYPYGENLELRMEALAAEIEAALPAR